MSCKFRLFVILGLLLVFTSGCSNISSLLDSANSPGNSSVEASTIKLTPTSIPTPTITPVTTTLPSPVGSTLESIEPSEAPIPNSSGINEEDFNVEFRGTVLNSKTTLEDLARLNITPVEEETDNIEFYAGSMNNGMNYDWYKVLYPSRKNNEFELEFIHNASKSTGRIVSVDLLKIPTNRGVSVGDTLETFKQKYGDNFDSNYDTDSSEYIELIYNGNTLYFVYDKSTEKILDISIDYDSYAARVEMGIDGAD